MIVGIDHGYYAIKTKHVSFPSGIIEYDYEPYTMQNVLQYRGKYYVCGTGIQTLVKNESGTKGGSHSGSWTAFVQLWKGETGISGVSVAERTASALFIRK